MNNLKYLDGYDEIAIIARGIDIFHDEWIDPNENYTDDSDDEEMELDTTIKIKRHTGSSVIDKSLYGAIGDDNIELVGEIVANYNQTDLRKFLGYLATKRTDSCDKMFIEFMYLLVNINDSVKIALVYKNLDLVEYLLKTCHDIDVKTDDNFLIKYLSTMKCYYKSVDVLRQIIVCGGDVTVDNNFCIRAAGLHNSEYLELLVENGADIRVDRDRPIRQAAYYGNTDGYGYLIRMGADVNADNGYIIRRAVGMCNSPDYDYFKMLLDSGAKIDYLTPTDIGFLVQYCKIDTIKLFMDAGLNLDILTKYQPSNINDKTMTMINLLIDRGFDCKTLALVLYYFESEEKHKMIQISDNIYSKIRSTFKYRDAKNDVMMESIVLNNGIEIIADTYINSNDTNQMLILRNIIKHNKIDIFDHILPLIKNICADDDYLLKLGFYYHAYDICQRLIENGADVTVDKKFCFLSLCAGYPVMTKDNFLRFFRMLIDSNADIITDESHLIYYFSQWDDVDILKFIIDNGANLTMIDASLKIAVNHGNVKTSRYLIQLGADVNCLTLSDFHLPIKNSNLDIINLLIQYGYNFNQKFSYDRQHNVHIKNYDDVPQIIDLLMDHVGPKTIAAIIGDRVETD